MAFGLMDVFVKIGADTSDLKKGIDESKGLVGGLGEGLKGAVTGGLTMAGAAIGAATSAVGAFAASSVKVGSSFDSSMAQVAATMGKTVDEIGDLRQFAQDMGATTAFSATQAADALNYMALAGYDANQSMEMLPNVLNLAAAGDMELARASDMVTDAQSALGLSAEETTDLVDMMAKASSKSNTSVAQLGDAILTVGGTAKTLAGGTNELNTALGILADNGIKGSEGGTKLRNVILSLSAPTDNAAGALADLGVKTVDAAGNLRPLEDIMGELGDAMDGLGTADRAEIISTIFNKTDIAAVNALLDTSSERWDELSDAIYHSSDAAEAMAKTQLDNLAGDVTLFKSALEGAQILVSDQLTPTLRDFVKFGTDGLTEISDAFKEGGLDGAMTAFGDVLSKGLSMIIGKLPQMIDAGMKLIGALGQGLLDNLPVLIDATIEIGNQILNGIVEALPAVAEGAVQIIAGLANGIAQMLPTLIPTIVEVVTQIVQTLIENVPLLINAAIQLVQGLAEGILNSIPVLIEMAPMLIESLVKAITEGVPSFVQGAINLIQGIVTALPRIIQSLILALPTVIDALVNGLMSSLPVMIQGTIQLVMALVKAMPQIIKALVAAVPTIIKTITDALINNLPMIIQGLVDLIAQIVVALPEIIMAIIQVIPTLIASIVQAILTSAPLIFNAVVQILSTIGTTLVQKGAEFLGNVGQTMSDIYNKVIEWLSQLPERMAYWAGYAIVSFMKFIKELPGKIKTEFDNVMSKLREFATNFINKARETSKEFLDKLLEKIKEAPEKLKELGNDMIDALKELPEKFKQMGKDMIQGLINGLIELKDKVVETVKGIVNAGYKGGKDAAESKSPSKKFKRLGRWLDQGLIIGMEDELPEVRKTAQELVDAIHIPDQSVNFSYTGSADEINSAFRTSTQEGGEVFGITDMVDAFVKALDKYGLTVEVDNRELGRVVRREVMA